MDLSNRDELYHYGMPRRSGRYPWGSGENPYQHEGSFSSRYRDFESQGLSEKEIATAMGFDSTTQLRLARSMARSEERAELVARAQQLRDHGYSLPEIARRMGYNNESSVRSLLNESSKARMQRAQATADFLKERIKETGMPIDIGSAVEIELGISKEKLREAVKILEDEGYVKAVGRINQATNSGKMTTVKVLGPPGTPKSAPYNSDQIATITDYKSGDRGDTFKKAFVYPSSMDSSRLMIRYGPEGKAKDGTIEIRRGVEDLSLGKSHYAQVRILVDDDRYLKGMAWYSDNLPDGVDVIFNTNKPEGTPMRDVLKEIHREDPMNPFGSLIKEDGGQSYYIGKDGKEHLSLINKRAEEGDWGEWADKLPSQFLSKQPLKLVKSQLALAKADKVAEFDEIKELTNPTVKKKLLLDFAESCDAAAEHLKAAALPRQKYQVILPDPTLKDNEVYAPNFNNGEEVVLVRFPYAGAFESPRLKVNNNHKESIDILGKNPVDAICVNSKVASQMSGADFDGDTVLVIPSKNTKILTKKAIDELANFDPDISYPEVKGMKYMTKEGTQTEMGKISNLITDMTLRGAPDDEVVRAVKHSMVVIDAFKHKYDYKRSERENGIPELKKRWQGHIDEDGKYREGAGTLISRAKSEVSVDKRQGSPKIDPETGKWIFKTADPDKLYYTYTNKRGKEITKKRTQKSTRMAEADDARQLISDAHHPTEEAYASYANSMKAMANEARKMYMATSDSPYSPSAAKLYSKEVASLDRQLRVAELNAPRERKAQSATDSEMRAIKRDNPDLTKREEKKLAQQALTRNRNKFGVKRIPIDISDSEWEAIQSGAISKTKLAKIINHADIDILKEKATPRTRTLLTPGKQAKIDAMKASGLYTNAEIAKAVGVSASTISSYLSGKNKK